MSKTHREITGTRHDRQTLRESFNGRQGQTRAMRADVGARRTIAEALADMDDELEFFMFESDEPGFADAYTLSDWEQIIDDEYCYEQDRSFFEHYTGRLTDCY